MTTGRARARAYRCLTSFRRQKAVRLAGLMFGASLGLFSRSEHEYSGSDERDAD
jgi:hypothetical protein